MRTTEGLEMLKKLLGEFGGQYTFMVLLLQEVRYILITHKHISTGPYAESIFAQESGQTPTAKNWNRYVGYVSGSTIPDNM